MTTANQAAVSAKNPETGSERVEVDLGLDSIIQLKQYSQISVSSIAHPVKLRGWLESSASEGEKWLRSSAQDGDLYAMEKLGLRLLTGDGLPKSLEGKKALLYLPENDEDYDVVFLQTDSGVTLVNSLNDRVWRKVNDARLSSAVMSLNW